MALQVLPKEYVPEAMTSPDYDDNYVESSIFTVRAMESKRELLCARTECCSRERKRQGVKWSGLLCLRVSVLPVDEG